MAKKFLFVCAGILMLAGAFALGANSVEADSPRYQVIPGTQYLAFLKIDTQTGQAWLTLGSGPWEEIE